MEANKVAAKKLLDTLSSLRLADGPPSSTLAALRNKQIDIVAAALAEVRSRAVARCAKVAEKGCSIRTCECPANRIAAAIRELK